jgi:hypothetical protein
MAGIKHHSSRYVAWFCDKDIIELDCDDNKEMDKNERELQHFGERCNQITRAIKHKSNALILATVKNEAVQNEAEDTERSLSIRNDKRGQSGDLTNAACFLVKQPTTAKVRRNRPVFDHM